MSGTIDKIGATLTMFFGAIAFGYSTGQAVVAALVTWVLVDVISLIRLRRKIRQQRKDHE